MTSKISTIIQLPQVSVPSYDPNDPNYIVAPGSGFDGVVNITDGMYTGSGVLLESGRHILTAAHVVENMPYDAIDVNADFAVGRETFDVTSATLHPNWSGNWGYDLAILELDESLSASGFSLYEGSQEIGQEFTLVGYGVKGTGNTGIVEPDYSLGETKRMGNNVWEAFDTDFDTSGMGDAPEQSLLLSDFDSGYSANDALGHYLGIHDLGLGSREVASTGGDSGGPLFLNVNGEWQVAGIVNAGIILPSNPADATFGTDSSYGEISVDARVSYYSDWIHSVIGQSVPDDDDNDDSDEDDAGGSGGIDDGDSVGTPTVLYLGDSISDIVVTSHFELRPQSGISYDQLNIIMHNPDASVTMSTALAKGATLTLHSDGSYAYSVNMNAGTLDITQGASDQLVTALPIDSDTFSTLPVRIGEQGPASPIVIDPETFDILSDTLPVEAGDNAYNEHYASEDVSAQTLQGSQGQLDFFIFDIQSDANGAFSNFGQAIVDSYDQADGDKIIFIDQANQWNTPSQVITAGISSNDDGVVIDFHEDLNVTLNEQSLQILGAEKDNPFSSSLDTLNDSVDFAVATSQGVASAGGLDNYLDSLVA